jgi:hypothetical protein
MIVGQAFANAPPSQTGLCRTRLREDDRKLIAAIPRWGVYRPVGETENIRQTLERPVSREMAAATALHPVHDREQSGALPFASGRSQYCGLPECDELQPYHSVGVAA